MMTCAEVIAAAKILGIKADVKVCAVTNSHGKKHGKVYEKRGDEDYVSIMYNKPPIQPSTSTYPEKPYKSEYPLTPPGYPTTPDKPPVQLPAPERSRCMACKPPKPLVYPPITEKPPCKTCRPPKPPIQPLVPLPTNEKSPKPPVYLPALPHMPPTCLPTPDRPCSPKIM
ncbi:hypothetical protein K7432_013386 [Basidiobolus ranarum]|uniref:Uncharacterized protein n=1 Tax=Basidiobolus ranarum TaxID=34480 RepID=A0ABR2VQW1_9FUNG